MAYKDITPPAGGKITIAQGKLNVPENPIIPFIRGDGTGPDIWAASERVFDAAIQKAYGGKRKVSWFEVFAGEQSFKKLDTWLPEDTLAAFREHGKVGLGLLAHRDEAPRVERELSKLGIELAHVAERLQAEAVRRPVDALQELEHWIAERRR